VVLSVNVGLVYRSLDKLLLSGECRERVAEVNFSDASAVLRVKATL
jgi:hypothetical protein